jgi:ABC-2 type transport system ATP-binding protein
VSVTCDRVINIDRGHILAEDTTERLHRRVQGVYQTLVRVEGPKDEILRALRAVPDVSSAEERSVPSDAAVRVLVTSEHETVRKDLARAVVERGWSLVEVSPVAMTLEDLFVRLVEDDRDDRAAAR